MKRQLEKPVTINRAVVNERYQEAMREAYANISNPYESDKHQEAQDYIRRRRIKVKALRGNHEMDT